MPPFGYVNENHAAGDTASQRNEDHVGHKVLVANNWQMYDATSTAARSCDVVIKVHMGTHSPDALVNTAHEMFLAGQCDGAQPFNTKTFALFGAPGSFKETEIQGCDRGITPQLAPNPLNQPTGGAHRSIPTRDCFLRGSSAEQREAATKRTVEFWLTGVHYFAITNPARVYDPTSPARITRTIDLCYEGDHPLAQTLLCQEALGAGARIGWDDPRSPFRGSVHSNTHFSTVQFDNAPATLMYSDAYGRTWLTAPDPSRGVVLKQLVPTRGFHYKVDGQLSVFPNADYSAGGRNGVRAPN